MLDLRVETFLCVCRNMNFTRSAQELNLTQPAVSQHIHYLEGFYGAKLFTYEKKQLRLTAAGEFLRRSLQSIYSDEQRIREKMSDKMDTYTYNLGVTLSVGGYFLPVPLAKYLKANPETHINISSEDTGVLLSEIDKGNIDFAFIEGYFSKKNYAYRLMKKERICAVCSPNLEIEECDDISKLFSYPLLIREKGSGTRDVLERGLKSHGYSTKDFISTITVNSLQIIEKLLLEGVGISFVYSSVAQNHLQSGRLKEIAISDFSLSHEFNAIWRKGSLFSDDYEKITSDIMSFAQK